MTMTLQQQFGRCLLLSALLALACPRVSGMRIEIVGCKTTEGPIIIEVYPDWAPLGAKRFIDLVKDGYFTDAPMYRVVKGFLAQFGVAADPKVTAKWNNMPPLKDDPNQHYVVTAGSVGFSDIEGAGKNSRKTELYISFQEFSRKIGRSPAERPIGQVSMGMDVVKKFYDGYGELKGFGSKTNSTGKIERDRLFKEGNEYAKAEFPKLSYILECKVEEEEDIEEEVRYQQVKTARGRVRPGEPRMSKEEAERLVAEMDIENLAKRFDQEAMLEEHRTSVVGYALKIISLIVVVMLVIGFLKPQPKGPAKKGGTAGYPFGAPFSAPRQTQHQA